MSDANRLLNLPEMCWELILRNLKPRHKAAVRSTCSRLRELANNSVHRIKLDPTHIDEVKSWELHVRFPRLAAIDFFKPGEYDSLTDTLLTEWALQDLVNMPHLVTLNMEHLTQVSVAGLQSLALACTRITNLTLPKLDHLSKSEATLLVLERLPDLRCLRLLSCRNCDSMQLRYLSRLTRLTALELEDTGSSLIELLPNLPVLSSLSSLMVWSEAMPDSDSHEDLPVGFVAIPVAAGVLALADHIAAGGPGPGGGAAGLLALAAPPGAAVGGPLVPQNVGPTASSSSTRSMHLDTKACILEWATSLTSLTHMDIQRVDMGAEDLLKLTVLTGLEHLGMGDLSLSNLHSSGVGGARPILTSVTKLVAHNISKEEWLSRTFPSLRALSCDADDNILAAVANMTQLRGLFLWRGIYGLITNEGLKALSGLTCLETFRLDGSDCVTNYGWKSFAEGLTRLTKLDIVGCPGLGSLALVLSAPRMKRLRHVSIVDCPNMRLDGIAALYNVCPLDHLELVDCPQISQAELRDLLENMPKPDIDVVYNRGGASRVLHS